MPDAPHIVDTLQCDTVLLRQLQSSPEYDYSREFIESDKSVIEAIMDYLGDLFSNSMSHATSEDTYLYWIIGAVVILIAAFVYLYNHDIGIFRRSGQTDVDYEVEDEDIYSIDFDTRITRAEQQADWREATRLTYLKTLRWLADNGHIEWALFKTPTQYTREERSLEFRDMTNEFLRVRYGNFEASRETYRSMCGLSDALITRLAALKADEQAKGGEA